MILLTVLITLWAVGFVAFMYKVFISGALKPSYRDHLGVSVLIFLMALIICAFWPVVSFGLGVKNMWDEI